MASPQGRMIVPLIVNPSGDIRTLECDASDRLKVSIDAITAALVATQSNPDSLRVGNYLWDGSAWQKVSGNASGEQQNRVGYDGANWQRLATDSNGVQKTLSGLDGTTYRGLKVDANGRLSVDINSAPTITNQNKVYDGANWQNQKGDTSGRTIVDGDSPSLLRPLPKNTNFINTSLPAGTSAQTIVTVPASETWRFTTFSMYYVGTVAGVSLTLFAVIGGTNMIISFQTPVVSGQPYYYVLNILLTAGDIIKVNVIGATAGDDLIANAFCERVY